MKIIIKEMKTNHLEEVLKIEKESFEAPWSWKSFEQELKENPYALYLTAVFAEKKRIITKDQFHLVAAYIGGWIVNKELHITNLAVRPEYRRKGIARKLIREINFHAHKKGAEWAALEVRYTNKPAINLYKSMGFKSVGYKAKYYSNNNEDALIMWREFKDNE